MAKHSRLYSSITFKSLRFLPSEVLIELKVVRSYPLGRIGQNGTRCSPDAAQWALALAIGHTQAFCTPKPVEPLVV